VGGGDGDEPLDPRQLDHINRDPEEDDQFGGGSQLTANNVTAMDNMNNGQYMGGDLEFNQYRADDVYDAHPQDTGFQTL